MVSTALLVGLPMLGFFLRDFGSSSHSTPHGPASGLREIVIRDETITVNMRADDVFEILRPSDVYRQDTDSDPQIPGSMVVTKYVRASGLDRLAKLEFRRRGPNTPYYLVDIALPDR